ncbi:MAG: antA/AntB antirepressor family protein [Zoogloeaceae bacterium]|nr:antA/AntB antirepressor family protein [Zoogloeaceae bacterium]
MSQPTTGALAPVRHTIRRLEETRRHPFRPEKISLDITSDSTLFIINKPSFPIRLGDILTRTTEGLFHPDAPGVNLFEEKLMLTETSGYIQELPFPPVLAKPLIPVSVRTLDGAQTQTVNARELHEFLENGDKFATWIKDRIQQFNFAQGIDFEVFREIPKNSNGGRPSEEYALTLDMAKELSMVERNEKGKQARQYFIECERRAKQTAPIAIPTNLRDALLLAAELEEKREAAEAALALAAPKVAALSRIEAGEKSLTITEAAKVLGVKRDVLTKRLNAEGWIYRQNKSWVAHSAQIHAGRLEYKEAHFTDDDGHEVAKPYCHLTPKGLAQLAQMMS